MASASASADAWVYDPSHQVYYHASSQTYAIPDARTGEWSYLAARDFRPGESSTSTQHIPAQNGGREMEEGEVEEDVGWGGLMEPEELERALKAKSKGTGDDTSSRKPFSSSNGIGSDKHPAYGHTPTQTQPYDDPAKYAWPPREPTPPQKEMPNHILRLVVKRGEILSPGQVAVIDAREGGVQLGRDRVEKGGQVRLRLREMEVSKTHAVVYWGKGPGDENAESGDGDRGGDGDDGWWLVDLGSTHGTFLRYQADNSGQAAAAAAEPVRLSEPKHSSVPHRLTHLCGIAIGSTSLIAHIHPSWPCGDCQITGDNEIRLDDGTSLDKPKESDESALALAQLTAEPAKYAMDSNERRHNRELKRKREMAALRETLLNPGGSTPSPGPTDADREREKERSYLDRSAMRRRLHPQSPPPPSSSSSRRDRDRAAEIAPCSNPTPSPQNPSRPAEPAGQSQSKFGLAMLANQGWTPGMGLGKTSEGRAEPVQVEQRTEKRGLGATGSKAVADVGEGDWRQRGKQRRYDELRSAQ